MNISVEKKFENPILKREDIEFKMEFDSAIPSREQAKSALSSAISIPKERIVIISIESNYGRKTVNAHARVYETEELAAAEKQHLLKRDGMGAKDEAKDAKPAEKKAEKKPEPKKEEKKEEKKPEENKEESKEENSTPESKKKEVKEEGKK